MAKETTRVQFEMASQSMDRLKALRDKTEAASYAEVVRRALQLYEALIEETETGGVVAIRRQDGDEVKYRPIF